MAYTKINGMRSTRYPFQGCGCAGIGQDPATTEQAATAATSTILFGAALLAVGYVGWQIIAATDAPKRNRRRR